MEPPFEHWETFGVVDELCLLKKRMFFGMTHITTLVVITTAMICDTLNDITPLRRDLIEIIDPAKSEKFLFLVFFLKAIEGLC